MKLINAYRSRRFLWDNTAHDYTDRNKRNAAWKTIADEVGCDVTTVERKLKSVKTHFMAVHKAYTKRRIKAASNTGTVAIPKWFAYDALSFLVRGRLARLKGDSPNAEKETTSPVASWKPHEVSTTRDEFTVFAEHIAIRLKKITDTRTRLVVQHQINNILFEAEMGKYNVHPYNTDPLAGTSDTPPPIEEKVMMNLM